MSDELVALQDQRDSMVAEVQIAQLKNALKAENSITEHIETWHEIPVSSGQRELELDEPLFGHGYPPRPQLYTSLSDRKDGRFLPYYEHEFDLRRMRARSRSLGAFTSVALGAVESLANYVIGSGVTIEAQTPDGKPNTIQVIAQRIIDETMEVNDVAGNLDREIHDTSVVEGEAFAAIYPNEDGTIDLGINDNDTCRRPDQPHDLEKHLKVSHKLNSWWYGVHTQHSLLKRRMDTKPLGYHFVYDEAGSDWDYIPAERVQHFKRNVIAAAPRGISDFVPIDEDLKNESKLRTRTAVGAAIQASIALVREHAEGTTKDQVADLTGDVALATYQRATPNSTVSENAEHFPPGKIVDLNKGQTYTGGPLGTTRSPIYIQVAGYVLRSIGNRWQFPEYMISGDASNANFASTLVAESPFTKSREKDQGFYTRGFKALFWKVLMVAYKMGRFGNVSWMQVLAAIDLMVTLPEVASRDKLKQAQTNSLLFDKRLLSGHTWTTESGHDYDEEQKHISTEPEPPAPGAGPAPQAAEPQPNEAVREQLSHHIRRHWLELEGKSFTLLEQQPCLS